MSDETTKDLTPDEKLDLIIADLAAVKMRLTGLEEDVTTIKANSEVTNTRLSRLEAIAEDRSRETRPQLERIHKEIADTRIEMSEGQQRLESRLDLVNQQLEVMTLDVMEMRTARRALDKRVAQLERQPA